MIKEGTIKTAIRNSRRGEQVMTLLLNQRSQEVIIIDFVVKTVAENRGSGKQLLTLLLNR